MENDKKRVSAAQARTFERAAGELAAGLARLAASIMEDLAKFNEETADDIDQMEKVENVEDFGRYFVRSWRLELERFHMEDMPDLSESLACVVYEVEDGEE